MTTPNARKGAEAERMVAKYLREQGFPNADRRLREGRADDQGDIDGVPYTVIQVKYVAKPAYQEWVTDTLKQRDNADAEYCMLVRRVPRKPVAEWEAWMPTSQLADIRHGSEAEAWTWVCMNLRLAVCFIKAAEKRERGINSLPSWPTTLTTLPEMVRAERKAWHSAPSTENGSPPSPTT